MLELQTRMDALGEAGATKNYSKIIELGDEYARLDKIERSHPQINKYIKPIAKPIYSEKPAGVNKPIPIFEIPKNVSIQRNKSQDKNTKRELNTFKPPTGAIISVLIVGLSFISVSKIIEANMTPEQLRISKLSSDQKRTEMSELHSKIYKQYHSVENSIDRSDVATSSFQGRTARNRYWLDDQLETAKKNYGNEFCSAQSCGY